MGALKVLDICAECDDSVDIGGRIGCKHIGAWLESGGQRKWQPSCCALLGRQLDPTAKCANPATPDKWDGATRPVIEKPRPLKVLAASRFEQRIRICMGHKTLKEDRIEPCPEYAKGCAAWKLPGCPLDKWPD